MQWRGELLHIHIAAAASLSMESLSVARLIAGEGLEGDRYAARQGTYSKNHHIDRQATLIEAETLDALARDRHIELLPEEHRRNFTTRGVPLNHLVGHYFQIGDCLLYGGRLNVPCVYLENRVGKKVFKPLLNRSGLNCRIIVGGTVKIGDRIVWRDPESVDSLLRSSNESIPLERPPDV